MQKRGKARAPLRAPSLVGGRRWEPELGTKRRFLHQFHRREHSPRLLLWRGIGCFGPALSLWDLILVGKGCAEPGCFTSFPTDLDSTAPKELVGMSSPAQGSQTASFLGKN